jgi:cobalamin-dependent methionine synthase I
VFVVVGERINTSRKRVQEAVTQRDSVYIQEDVRKQQAAGAHFIDVNAGARIGHEKEDMEWLLTVIQEVVTIPLCLDSPDPGVLEMAYGMVRDRPMINSISLEKARYDAMVPFLKGKKCSVVALCMDDTGMPKTSQDVIDRAKKLVKSLEEIGIERNSIYIDPLVQPISADTTKGVMALDSVQKIMSELPGVHTICGLSNISYGLPQRKIINRTFLTFLMSAGLDTALIDPLDNRLMAVLKAAEMLLGNDEYCKNYLTGVRSGLIVS